MINSMRFLRKKIRRNTGVWIVIAVISLLLSGCVDYQVGTTFYNANSGELTQQIKLGEKLTSFSGASVYDWLDSIERRARNLNGKVQRVSPEEILVRIPFNSAKELQDKFSDFFHPNGTANIDKKAKNQEDSQIPVVDSNLLLKENNFLLLTRNKLTYDLDLSSLDLVSNDGSSLINSGSILDLQFALKTPLGAKNINTSEDAVIPIKEQGKLVWHLQPGQLNHIEVAFWLPNNLGIGTLLIILFVWGGTYLRYTYMPDPRIQTSLSTTSATVPE